MDKTAMQIVGERVKWMESFELGRWLKDNFEDLKAIEKQQIIEAWDDWENIGHAPSKTGEDYYNSKYKTL